MRIMDKKTIIGILAFCLIIYGNISKVLAISYPLNYPSRPSFSRFITANNTVTGILSGTFGSFSSGTYVGFANGREYNESRPGFGDWWNCPNGPVKFNWANIPTESIPSGAVTTSWRQLRESQGLAHLWNTVNGAKTIDQMAGELIAAGWHGPCDGEGDAAVIDAYASTTKSSVNPVTEAPTVNLKINNSDGPVQVDHNSKVNISWSSTNSPTSCSASGAWSGSKAGSGSETSGTLAGGTSGTDYTYTLSCTNSSGSGNDSVTVHVNPPSNQKGSIQGLKLLMPNNQDAEPAKSQNVTLDGNTSPVCPLGNPPCNPFYFLNLTTATNHTVSVPDLPGYSIAYTLCYNDFSCHNNTTPTPGRSVTVNIPAGTCPQHEPSYGPCADLWWHYTPSTTTVSSCASSVTSTQIKFRNSDNSGSWTTSKTIRKNQGVKVAGFHNNETSDPPPADITTITVTGPQGFSTTMANGAIFNPPADLPLGGYSFSANTAGINEDRCKATGNLNTVEAITFTKSYKIAESKAGLDDPANDWKPYTQLPLTLSYSLAAPIPTPGEIRTVFVQFQSDAGQVSQVFTKKIKFVPDPKITSADCHYAPTGVGTEVTIKGLAFGIRGNGKVKISGEEAEVTRWDETANTVVAKLSRRLEGKTTIGLTSNDGLSAEGTCTINTTTIEFAVSTQCSPQGSINVSSADTKIFEAIAGVGNPDPILRQNVSFDAKGKPTGFAPKLEKGKNYTIIIKAPGTLARKKDFKAEGGTTQLETISLSVGDIAPAQAPDGKINALDTSELKRQWSLVADVARTGDFNQDSRINSLDYACMRTNFNASDEGYSAPAASATASPVPSASQTATPSASGLSI